MASSPENNPEFSATAYFFGRELRKELNVPVGLIKCAWGGSRVEPWIPAGEFRKDTEMAAYFESSLSALKAWDPNKAEADYQAAVKKWETKGKGRKPKKPAEPKNDKQFPSTLFNAMVHPVIPYAIRGAIWYQGEENARHNTENYEDNFRTMISSWREHWGQGDFPFYFAQLASFKNPVAKPVEYDGWASVCDQQRRVLSLKNTGMAVLSDIGEANDIHPHNKVAAGKRLALWALKNDYPSTVLRAGKKAGDLVCSGPLYKRHKIKDGTVVITFDSVGTGLMSGVKTGMADTKATDEPLKHFQICGADRQWKWAQAGITGKDSVTVSHPDVPEPVVVRYAWASNPEGANLYNKEGLPTSIFTTEAEIPASNN
jgi:sialate O-acetylesterase